VSFLRSRSFLWWWLPPLLVACTAAPSRQHATNRVTREASQHESRLYAADAALRDALSGPWQYVGTGKWPGIDRMYACAFRNAHVFIVNVYCGIKDRPAVRIDVYSPVRGRVSIYAEAKTAISELSRGEYFTFMVDSTLPPHHRPEIPRLTLAMSFAELREYEQRRYSAFLPACYGGMERSRPRSGCLDTLASRKQEWVADNRTFLEHGSENWKRIVRELRVAAERYGKEPN
jgi:hypothetical protein